MKQVATWWKGVLGLVALVLAFAWLLRTAREGALVGRDPEAGEARVVQEGSVTGTAPVEDRPLRTATHALPATALPSSTAPAGETALPSVTVIPTVPATLTAIPADAGTVRIVYAVQPPGKAVTLWTLDYDPAAETATPRELSTSPFELITYFRAYEIALAPDRQHVAVALSNLAHPWEYAVSVVGDDGLWSSLLTSVGRWHVARFWDWMPDSKRLLGGEPDWVAGTVGLSGGDFSTLLSFSSEDRTVPDSTFDNGVEDAGVSPNGQRIAFSVGPWNEMWLFSLAEDALDIGSIERIAIPTQDDLGFGAYSIEWSPSGEKIAYTNQLSSEFSEIQVMDALKGTVVFLSSSDAHNFHPRWSPDGSTLAYIRETTPGIVDWNGGDPTRWDSSVWVADVETGVYHEIVPSEGKACWSADWLPDGLSIVFVSNRKGQSDVWLVNRDGTGLRQLTDQGDVVALDVAP